MNDQMMEKFNRGRRILKELEEVLDNYQKLEFYINSEDHDEKNIEILKKQSAAMKEYIDVLLERIANTAY
ncbi:crAss001_48 related protein [Aedoeadaptatus coxii]|uniref:crAss001_48 related protein n=1 Tax=Aedoeadaptatus coxii TaxID=755172 RepID=UPI002AD31AB5|nr:hypothetical protein [Peptoniphilus coxii]